jgi:type II secretory pathway predicted ATPase ExeA
MKGEFYQKWGWIANPFILKIDPKLFTGYHEQVEAVKMHIADKHKIAMVSGPTGSGKTSMLKWLEEELHETNPVLYISKPPQKPDEFIDIFTETFGVSFWLRRIRWRPNMQSLPSYINGKLKGQHLVFMVDEAHETNKDVLEWLRVLVDQIGSVSLIVAGLPSLEKKLKDELETFDQRITTRIELQALEKADTKDLIKKRVESVGGNGTVPFTDSAVDRIFEKTGGFPREVLKMCDRLIHTAMDKDLNVIEVSDIEDHREVPQSNVRVETPVVTFSPKPPSKQQIDELPYKQKKILEILSQDNWLTPTAISEKLDNKNYQSKGHAIRAMNNILHRLMIEGFVQREARGKAFMYALTPRIKTLYVEK